MQSILAIGVAPMTVAIAGVLMPGRDIWHRVPGYYSVDFARAGRVYTVQNLGTGVLVVYPGPVQMDVGEVRTFKA